MHTYTPSHHLLEAWKLSLSYCQARTPQTRPTLWPAPSLAPSPNTHSSPHLRTLSPVHTSTSYPLCCGVWWTPAPLSALTHTSVYSPTWGTSALLLSIALHLHILLRPCPLNFLSELSCPLLFHFNSAHNKVLSHTYTIFCLYSIFLYFA